MAIQQIQPDVRLPKTKKIKRYVALLSQTGTFNPTVIELQNTTNQVITWTRDSTGRYEATFTIIGVGRSLLIQPVLNNQCLIGVDATKLIVVTTNSTGTATDDVLNNTTVQVEIFTDYE